MPTVFSRIIAGELPARIVWTDDVCVAFLTIAPLRPGHALVVPRAEVDQWTDADDALLAHLVRVGKRIGAAQRTAFGAARTGLVVAGFEVPHLHLHVFPADEMSDFDFTRADTDADPADLDAAAGALRAALGGPGAEGGPTPNGCRPPRCANPS